MSLIRARETWNWIRNIEKKYTMNDRVIPDKMIDILIGRLYTIEQDFIHCNNAKYKDILNRSLIPNFDLKLTKSKDTDRFMLFDFMKNLIHECLL